AIGQLEKLENKLTKHGITVITSLDLVGAVWVNQPDLPQENIYTVDVKYVGESRVSKLGRIRQQMKVAGADYHLISTIDDMAWIFNIRGADVEFNPVAVSYGLVSKDDAIIYIQAHKVPTEIVRELKTQGIIIKDYTDIIGDLNNLEEEKTIHIDPSNCSVVHYKAINSQKVRGQTIARHMKAIKNETEIAHTKNVMVKDCIAIAKTFYWLDKLHKAGETCTEAEFSDKLALHRSQQADYVGESFPAIIGYKGNGAIIHYRPMHGFSADIKPDGILLADSGGQYLDGTTDITRTVALGTPTDEEKRNFTLVLKGMIGLTKAQFPKGTTGGQLDVLARMHLWEHGLNYGHGTGHGVGFFLNVHEPPQGFAPPPSERATTPHEVGMYTSNEPGYYKEGSYGIRIENLMFTVNSDMPGYLKFDTVTLYPIDIKLIDENILTKKEKAWLNNYHHKVWSMVGHHLEGEIKTWFELKCRGMN
ncbi:UNVERIFIED_CONTAM: hypothetical protein GTU68_013985, partial [Idotea baltica]|nr:hypothetical protein [Idotea baltica]